MVVRYIFVCIYLCACFLVVPAFFFVSYYSILFFLAKFMGFVVLLCFGNVLRCVVLAVSGLFGACLFALFANYIYGYGCLWFLIFYCTLLVNFLFFSTFVFFILFVF